MKIVIFSQIPDSPSTYYRAVFPFRHLSSFIEYDIISPENMQRFDRADLYKYDIAFFMRPHDPEHTSHMLTMSNMGVPLWIDYDDDLFSIPRDHKEWEYFQKDTTRQSIVFACAIANVVTVTTSEIKKRLIIEGVEGDKIHVVANAINSRLNLEPTPLSKTKSQTILWRGGFTHNRDLETIGPSVSILTRRGFRFTFFGHSPHAIEQWLTPGLYSTLPEADIFVYLKTLKRINMPMHIVPLIDIPLNRSKSSLAYLEASWIGGSNVFMPEWCAQPGAIGYTTGDDLCAKVETLANASFEVRDELHKEAINHIQSNYLECGRVNVQRTEILKRLLVSK